MRIREIGKLLGLQPFREPAPQPAPTVRAEWSYAIELCVTVTFGLSAMISAGTSRRICVPRGSARCPPAYGTLSSQPP